MATMRRPLLLLRAQSSPRVLLARRRPFSSTSAAAPGVAVRKVTRSNFDASLDHLRALVRESDFVAFDLEMSGVASAPWRESFHFDDFEVQYLKVKDSARKFAVLQFGVCPFRWDSSRQSFLANPYNFYLFPRKELPIDGPSCEFLCQTTSIDFLARHQFDFNACIHDGISYLSQAQESEALRIFSLAHENMLINYMNTSREEVEIPFVSAADIFFTERMKNRFIEWRNGVLKGFPADGHDNSKAHFETFFFKMRPAFLLNGFSSHQHKLIQMVIKKYFRDLVYVHTTGDNLVEQKVIVYSISEDDKALLMKEVQEDSWSITKAKIRCAVGFRHVIDLLASEKKLIVGHSCILDIAHIYDKFFGPLPSTVTEFASSLNKCFPHIIDTKHLLKVNDVVQRLMEKKSKSLSSVFSLLCPQLSFSPSGCSSTYHQHVKFEVPVDETGASSNSGAKHEAGYDAFMTGCVFAQACNHLGIDFKLQSSSLELFKNEKLQKHINLLYPNWKSDTVLDLKTGTEVSHSGGQNNRQKCTKTDFANIVLVWGFPSNIKPLELKVCISKAFGADSITSIVYLDETAALVQFTNRELAAKFLLLKDTLERKNNVISVLHPLAKLLEGGNTHAADYNTYKEICSSPASRVLFADQAETVGISWMTNLASHNVQEEKSADADNEQPATAADGIVEKSNVASFTKIGTEKRSDGSGESKSKNSCESTLDSLCAIKTLHGRQTST